MNGYDYSKTYGKHEYREDGTSDCAYGCGCWAGPSRSGGPTGVDPFGECPNNPTDGKRSEKGIDYEIVVERRIRKHESKIYELTITCKNLEENLAAVDPDKKELALVINALKSVLNETNKEFTNIETAAKQIRKCLNNAQVLFLQQSQNKGLPVFE